MALSSEVTLILRNKSSEIRLKGTRSHVMLAPPERPLITRELEL